MTAGRREAPVRVSRRVHSATVTADGQVERVRWEDQRKDLNGRPLHLLGLTVRMAATLAAVAASMPSAFNGERLYDLLKRVLFKVGAHSFIDNVRGYDIYNDQVIMTGFDPVYTAPSDIADADATPTAVATLFIPVAALRPAPGAEFDGAVPIAALRNEDMELTFGFGAFQEVAFAGLTATALTVTIEAHMVALTQLRVPTAHALRYLGPFTDLDKSFPTRGFIEHASVVDSHLAMQQVHTGYGDTTVRVGAGEAQPASLATLSRNALVDLQRRGIASVFSGSGLGDVTDPGWVPLVPAKVGDLLTRQPIGRLGVIFASRTNASTRILLRERGTRHDEHRRVFYERLGADPRALKSIRLRTSKKSADLDAWLRPHMDEAIAPPGSEFAAVAETPGR